RRALRGRHLVDVERLVVGDLLPEGSRSVLDALEQAGARPTAAIGVVTELHRGRSRAAALGLLHPPEGVVVETSGDALAREPREVVACRPRNGQVDRPMLAVGG